MASCNECFHCEACSMHIPRTFWDSDTFAKDCKYFENKSKIVELPCKVGDTVFYIKNAYYLKTNLEVGPIKVTEISIKNNRSGKDLGWSLIANGTRYKFSSIGKTVFLTLEEAKKALKELNKND